VLALSTNEIKAARKALCEVKAFDDARRIPAWIPLAICVLPVVHALDHLHAGHPRVLDVLLLSGLLVAIPYRWWRMSHLKSRYAANQSLLEDLRQSDQSQFAEIMKTATAHEEPLLEFWNRSLERRPILWRVDAFLSGEKVA
jgi:hypothetical protein